jgi:RP/EB family microtubule-associated protein
MLLTHLRAVDLPMSRVKFNVNSEYAYIQNFKVLQSKRQQLSRTKSYRC